MSRTVYYDWQGNEIEPPNAKPVPMTNYDRLISKTPGELAVFLSEATSNAIVVLGIGRNEKSKTAFDWYEWLKAPAEEGE